jgi:hypothetical protein
VTNTSACLQRNDSITCGLLAREPRYFDLGTLFGRVERFEAYRRRREPGAVVAPPRPLDAALLEKGAAFELAWAEEIAALIAFRRRETTETRIGARRARAATARLADRIETMRAVGLAGLKVKARAILWRRNGEPLDMIGADGQPLPATH